MSSVPKHSQVELHNKYLQGTQIRDGREEEVEYVQLTARLSSSRKWGKEPTSYLWSDI